MAYSYEQLFAVDPANTANIARAATITIFAPGDTAQTPLTLTTLDGSPLTNPLTTNANGYASAFMHATLDRVAWAGGGFTGLLTSYEGMKAEAVAARAAADTAAANAAAAATADLQARIDAGELKGDPGADGSNVLPTDTAIQQAINDTASATRGALNATYATKAELEALPVGGDLPADVKPRAIIFGTSLEAQSGGLPSGVGVIDTAMSSRGWPHHFNVYMEQRFDLNRNAGVGGNTFAQMLTRMNADVLAYPSDWVFIGGPVNDISAGRTTAQIKADLDAIHAAILADGRRILQLTCAPSDFYDTAAEKLVVDEINAYIWTLHQKNGVLVSDAFEVLRAAGGYGPATGMAVDGIHFSEQGSHLVGRKAAETVAAALPPLPRALQTPTGRVNVIGNAGFDSGTGWGAPPVNTTATYPNDGRLILKITGETVNTDDGVTYTENISSGRFAAGDYIQAVVRVRWWNASPLTTAAPFRPLLRIQQRHVDSVFGNSAETYFAASGDNRIWTKAPERGEIVMITQRLLVEATTDRLYIRVAWIGAANASIEFSGLQVYKA
jgi:lysophospholipase L1-like esterase